MKNLSHPQKRKSSLGTMKKGMKMGPTRTATAIATGPKRFTAIATNFQMAMIISMTTYSKLAVRLVMPGAGMRPQYVLIVASEFWSAVCPMRFVRYLDSLVTSWGKLIPKPGIGEL